VGASRFKFDDLLLVIFLSVLMMGIPFALFYVTGPIKPYMVDELASLIVNVLLCLLRGDFWEPPGTPTIRLHRSRPRAARRRRLHLPAGPTALGSGYPRQTSGYTPPGLKRRPDATLES
jgi:hypothetical protein